MVACSRTFAAPFCFAHTIWARAIIRLPPGAPDFETVMFRPCATCVWICALSECAGFRASAGEPQSSLQAGFAAVDITPQVGPDARVYLAGYGMNRKATGVHDPLYARTVVLADGENRIAISCVDL